MSETETASASAYSSSTTTSTSSSLLLSSLMYDRQVGYFAYCLRKLPCPYGKLDTNRLTLVHFAVQALDLLGGIWDNDDMLFQLRLNKQSIIEWIYALQITTQQVQDYYYYYHNVTTTTTETIIQKDDDEEEEEEPGGGGGRPGGGGGGGRSFLSLSSMEGMVGFKGGTFLGGSFDTRESTTTQPWHYNHGHIAMT